MILTKIIYKVSIKQLVFPHFNNHSIFRHETKCIKFAKVTNDNSYARIFFYRKKSYGLIWFRHEHRKKTIFIVCMRCVTSKYKVPIFLIQIKRFREFFQKKKGFRPKKSLHWAYIIYSVKTQFFKIEMFCADKNIQRKISRHDLWNSTNNGVSGMHPP